MALGRTTGGGAGGNVFVCFSYGCRGTFNATGGEGAVGTSYSGGSAGGSVRLWSDGGTNEDQNKVLASPVAGTAEKNGGAGGSGNRCKCSVLEIHQEEHGGLLIVFSKILNGNGVYSAERNFRK